MQHSEQKRLPKWDVVKHKGCKPGPGLSDFKTAADDASTEAGIQVHVDLLNFPAHKFFLCHVTEGVKAHTFERM
jgi:hypothetical protein